MQNWKEVWNRRTFSGGGELTLDTLIKLDGFDSGAGRIEPADWRAYVTTLAQKLNLVEGARVYEVGCGAGAFLYALRETHSLHVGGIDYAAGLIAAASRSMPDGRFTVGEASSTDIEDQYDYVIAHGVFHYFDLGYAAEVLDRMFRKARVAVAVMEIPDLATRDESEAMRRDMLDPQQYKIKYAGLEHTYFARDWFKAYARAQGSKCELFDGCVPNYAQNRFRFGCILRK